MLICKIAINFISTFLDFFNDAFYAFFNFHARCHYLMPTLFALNLEIDAGAQNDKPVGTARVAFFHNEDIA